MSDPQETEKSSEFILKTLAKNKLPCQKREEEKSEKVPVESTPDSEHDITKSPTPSDEIPVPLVLEPDHPMMQRFQIALKNHLLKQIDKLASQVSELDNEVKRKEKEREETGLELYAVQQEIFRQQKVLEDCEGAIEDLMKERQSLDESVQSKKISWKEEVNRLNCAKKKEMDMNIELQKLSSLEKQMESWKKEMESELNISQRVSEKTQYDKNKMMEEKRKMDMYLLKLMMAVSNYDAEIRLLEGEIDVKLEEKDELNQTLADAAADLQALMSEQKRLLSAWNSVVATIGQRNIIYTNVSNELTKSQEAFRSLNAEIESYKRSSSEEMKKGEKMALMYSRAESDFETSQAAFKNFMEKKASLEIKITNTAAMIQNTEAEYGIVKLEKEKIEQVLNGLRMSCEKLGQEKRNLEDEALNYLGQQILNDKTAIHLNKILQETRDKYRKQEIALLETENKISQKFLEVEELKETISRNNEIIKEMNKELELKEEERKKYEGEVVKIQSAIFKKQENYALLTRKIEKHLDKTSYAKPGQGLSQLRINELEKANAELQAKNDKLQSLWLLQQTNIVKLTQQRSNQLKDIGLLRKQVLLLQLRALKIEGEVEGEKKIENDVNKSIGKLQHKLVVLNEILVGKKGYKETLGKENSLVQTQFLQNLKDSELEQIRLKAEIKDLESNLEELAETMLANQREMLAWEKKIQSAVEAKNTMQKEKSSSGEIGQMKAEIHRMEVRYGQLKRAQEKLICDLEQCVLRRDTILEGANAMEKRQARGFNPRFVFQKKLDAIKNKIRTLRNEGKDLEKLITNTEKGQEELRKVLIKKDTKLAEAEDTNKKINLQLEEDRLRRCQNLEMLIRRQKKCKMYEQVKSGRHRMFFKNEAILDNEIQKVRNTNTALVTVMQTLIDDFPAYRFQLRKIYNTLIAKPS